MKQDFDFEQAQSWAEEIIASALRAVELPIDTEVDVTVTDDAEIRELNCRFRQIDRSTDVLSFPLNDP